MMHGDFQATITDPERAKDFVAVFGSSTVDIVGPIPTINRAAGLHGERRFYHVDLSVYDAATIERLVQHVAAKFKLPVAEVRRDLPTHGLPILASECTISINNPGVFMD